MDPARSLAPVLISPDLHYRWIYLSAPLLGALAAVAASYILRGPGGDPGGTRAARARCPDPATARRLRPLSA